MLNGKVKCDVATVAKRTVFSSVCVLFTPVGTDVKIYWLGRSLYGDGSDITS